MVTTNNISRFTPVALLLALLGTGQAAPALSQEARPDPSVELRREQEEEARRRALAAPGNAAAPKDLRSRENDRLPADETPCFRIREVRLRGNDAGHFDWALDALDGPDGQDSPMGRCLGVQAIALLQKRLQNGIIARGYVTSRVVVGNQNLADGVLVFEPVGGRLDRLVDGSNAGRQVRLDTAFPGQSGELLNLRDLEQGLENLQRVPTVTADMQIAPGQTPGRSDIAVSWQQDRAWRMALSLDDAGNDTTGRYQAGATLSADNPLGLSDLAYLSLTRGFGGKDGPSPKGTQALAVHYSVPVGYWLYRFNASHNTYHQTVEGAYDRYRYSGRSDNLEFGVDRVLLRDNRQILSAQTSLQHRRSNNHIDDTEVVVQRRAVTSLQLGLAHRLYLGRGVLQSELNYRQGLSGLGTKAAPEEPFGEGTSRYRLSTAALTLQMPWALDQHTLRYVGSLRLQKHHTRLTPQDRFSIGGRYSVRGFDNAASLVAESGAVWRNELALSFKDMPSLMPYVGLDLGQVSGPSTENLPGKRLTGAVLGLRGQIAGLQYELFYGRPVNKPPELRASPSTWGFMLYQSY